MKELYQKGHGQGYYYGLRRIDSWEDIDWEYSVDERGAIPTESWSASFHQEPCRYDISIYKEENWFYYNIVDVSFARYIFNDDMGAYEDETSLEELQEMLYEKLLDYLR